MIAVKHSLYAFQQAVGRSLHTLKFADVEFPTAPLSSPDQHSPTLPIHQRKIFKIKVNKTRTEELNRGQGTYLLKNLQILQVSLT